MAIDAPYPGLADLLQMIGEAGQRLSEIDATEGAAGNISAYVGWPVEPRHNFPVVESIRLPTEVPALADHAFLVTGSGRRLREIIDEPEAHLGFLIINPDGQSAQLFTSWKRRFARLTSELNSHLGIHQDQITRSRTNFHAIIHAQPPHLTYLSHLPPYRDELYLNRHILRWEPESIVQIPHGVGSIPFHVPGSAEQEKDTLEGLRAHQIVIWSKHGVIARSDLSVKRVADLIEYAETGAHYEYLNLLNGERGEGLTVDEIRAICAAWNVQQTIF